MMDGYSGEQLIIQYHDEILKDETILELQKARILEKCAEADRCMKEGSDEEIQLQNLLSQSIEIMKMQ